MRTFGLAAVFVVILGVLIGIVVRRQAAHEMQPATTATGGAPGAPLTLPEQPAPPLAKLQFDAHPPSAGLLTIDRYSEKPPSIIFSSAGRQIVTIHPDGRVTWTGSLDKASREFWSSVQILARRERCTP